MQPRKGGTYIANRVDVDVVLSVLRVRNERLNKEVSQDTSGVLNLLLLQGALSNPGAGLRPSFVEGEKTSLAAALDELIGLRNELGASLKEPREADLSLVQDSIDIVVIVEVQRCESGGRVVLSGLGERTGLDDGSASEVVVDDGLAIGLVDSLCGHGAVCVGEARRWR